MTTTVLAPTIAVGTRRAVADQLRALCELVADVQWPPWTEPRFDEAITDLRRTIDDQLERHTDELPAIAARLGLDYEAVERMTGDAAHVRRWVTVLAGSTVGGYGSPEVIAALLSVYLFVDELAFIGLLARAVAPA